MKWSFSSALRNIRVLKFLDNGKFADNGADKLTASHIALLGMSQAFSSIELPGMLAHRREIDT